MASQQLTCTVVVPCYNEAARLDAERFVDFLDQNQGVSFQFVNDCSRDETLAVLDELALRRPLRIHILDKTKNGGKGEAVRDGMLEAIRRGDAEVVGFWDADLATPLSAIFDLLKELESNAKLQMVLGSRVRLLGRAVRRKATRHYLGRVFATMASFMLSLPIYDTQCGAKLFRVSPQLLEILSTPFCSRWIFDVEILARYIVLNRGDRNELQTSIYEYPLKQWDDIAGSKVRPLDFVRAFGDLVKIHRKYLR